MKITWYGTATIGIDDGETRLLFDPFVRMNRRADTTPLEGFTGFDAVLITHGHFDHLYSVPALAEADKSVTVYCTKTPQETLLARGVPQDRIHRIGPGSEISIGAFTVRVWQFRHIVFDPIYILSVVPKCVVQFPRLFWQTYINTKFPENGEIVAYEIEHGGKRVFLTGSFRDTPAVAYPDNVDLLILANGGSVFVPEKTAGFIAKYHPKAILVDHFDNAFPPVTRDVSVKRLKKKVERDHPDIRFVIPEIGQTTEW